MIKINYKGTKIKTDDIYTAIDILEALAESEEGEEEFVPQSPIQHPTYPPYTYTVTCKDGYRVTNTIP